MTCRLAVVACAAALASLPGAPAVAQEGDAGSDAGYLALCHFNAEGSEQRSAVLLQLGALTDEKLENGDYRIFDRDGVLRGLYPQAVLGDAERVVLMFTTTSVLPVRSENEMVTLRLTRSNESPTTYQAALYTVGSTDDDPYAFSGRCTMGGTRGSASALFEKWQQRLMGSEGKP